MKIVEWSPTPAGMAVGASLLDRFKEISSFASSGKADIEALATAEKIFSRHLNDQITAFAQVLLPDSNLPIPLLLVGAWGIRVVSVSGARGEYRAKGSEWALIDAERGYLDVQPNLVEKACAMADAVNNLLRTNDFTVPDALPVLVFTNPRLMVETVQPTARVVQSDAVERYAALLAQEAPVVDEQTVMAVVDLLTTVSAPSYRALVAEPLPVEAPAPVEPVEVQAAAPEKPPSAPAQWIPANLFTRRQWIILAVLLSLMIIGFLAVILVAVLTG